jgi:superfamily II RNA helicase
MKITIEQYEHKVTHEVPFNDVDLDEAVRMVEGLLRAIGYHFSGNLEIVSEWSDNEETFKQQEQ